MPNDLNACPILDEAALNARIGEHIRAIRVSKKLSQKELGKGLNVSYQQIQKFENGSNRISAAQLYFIAERMETSIITFYGLQGFTEHPTPHIIKKNGMDAVISPIISHSLSSAAGLMMGLFLGWMLWH